MEDKFLYWIIKAKIPSWIKFWLWKKTVQLKYVLSGILNATSFDLTDTYNKKFKRFILKRNTVQDGTPTTQNPILIKNAGDNGTVNEKIVNKNIFDENLLLEADGWSKNNDIYSGTANALYNKYFNGVPNLHFEKNKQYTISLKAAKESGNLYIRFYYTDGTATRLVIEGNQMTGYSITSTAGKNIDYLSFAYGTVGSSVTYIKDFMIEQGTTATEYVPHKEQNLAFPMKENQKLLGYTADDGIHQQWKQYIITGNEEWELFNNKCVRILKNDVAGVSSTEIGNIISNKFIKNSANNLVEGIADYGIATRTNNVRGFTIRNKDCSTLQDYKDYFTEQYQNGTPVIVQYQLAEESIESYSTEQQAAYNQMQELETYKNVTHIYSEDETPANLEIQYYKKV